MEIPFFVFRRQSFFSVVWILLILVLQYMQAAAFVCFLKFIVARRVIMSMGAGKNKYLAHYIVPKFSNHFFAPFSFCALDAALSFSFTSFFFYEQYEAEIDALGKVLLNRMEKLKRWLRRYLLISLLS